MQDTPLVNKFMSFTSKYWPGRRLPLLLQDPVLDPASQICRNFIPETSFAFADIGVNFRPIVEESIRGEM